MNNDKNKDMENIGKHLMAGFLEELGKWFVIVIIVLTLFTIADNHWHIINRDDTDSPTELSGLKLLTDNRTGCQYLAVRSGGIVARMGEDGKQVCGATVAAKR